MYELILILLAIARAWREFDVNGDETVTIGEVDQVLSNMDVKISPEKKAQLEKDLDRWP